MRTGSTSSGKSYVLRTIFSTLRGLFILTSPEIPCCCNMQLQRDSPSMKQNQTLNRNKNTIDLGQKLGEWQFKNINVSLIFGGLFHIWQQYSSESESLLWFIYHGLFVFFNLHLKVGNGCGIQTGK